MPQLNRSAQEKNKVSNDSAGLNNMLNSLLQLATPNSTSNTMKQTQVLDPYQEGVKKALKQAGEAHTAEAIQQGVPASHIVQESGINQQDQGIQTLTGLLSMMAAGRNSSVPQSSNNQMQSPMLNPIQQQAQDIVKPATGFFGKLMENMGNAGIVRQGQLNNLATAQEIVNSRTPEQTSDIAVKQAVNEAEQVPLNQAQQATAQAGFNTAQIQAYNDMATRINTQIQSLSTEFDNERKTISPTMALGAALTGKPALTPKMVHIQSAISKLQNKLNDLNSRGPASLKNPSEKKSSGGFKVISVREK